jgi:phenylpyruvate tautomerase PptA (4-oxalocrotonate tautomerase family)
LAADLTSWNPQPNGKNAGTTKTCRKLNDKINPHPPNNAAALAPDITLCRTGRDLRYSEASMPSVLIEVRQQYSQEREVKIIDAVHAALQTAFLIPAIDKNVRLVVHEPHRFACPPDRAHPELYTHVSIDAFSGRSLDAKRNLYARLVENLEELGIPRDHVKILLREIPRENWGLGGGKPGSEIDLGFKVEV